MVFSIAKETHWPEDHILNMPLTRLLQYKHCALRSYGTDTYYVTSNEEKEELMELLNDL